MEVTLLKLLAAAAIVFAGAMSYRYITRARREQLAREAACGHPLGERIQTPIGDIECGLCGKSFM